MEFRLILQGLTQLGDDGQNLASRLQSMDTGLPMALSLSSVHTMQMPCETHQYPVPGKGMEPPPYRGDCARNSKKLTGMHWTIGDKMARTSTVSSDAVISALAGIRQEYLDEWLDCVKHYDGISRWHMDDSLPAAIQRCNSLHSKGVGTSFMQMLSYIELAVKSQRFVMTYITCLKHVQIETRQHTEEFYDAQYLAGHSSNLSCSDGWRQARFALLRNADCLGPQICTIGGRWFGIRPYPDSWFGSILEHFEGPGASPF